MTSFYKISRHLYYCCRMYYSLYVKHDTHTMECLRWRRDNGDSVLRLNYPLSKDSVVFDLGGYKGDWSKRISEKYNCYLFIFEPVQEFCSVITESFKHNAKALVFDFGLSNETRRVTLSVNNESSSIYKTEGPLIEISLVDICKFLEDKKIHEIDLIKINIEGGEYDLLKRMVETDVIGKCKDIQVQFHYFYRDAFMLRDKIRSELGKTHFITYDYPFIWENWRRKSNA